MFGPDDIRSYVFILEPKDGKKLSKFEEETLGYLEMHWNNYFGDPGFMTVGPFKFSPDQT